MNEHVVIHDDHRLEDLRGKEGVVMGRIDDIAIVKVEGRAVHASLLPGEYTRIRTLTRVGDEFVDA